jgi:ribonuclease P/MRP protein subunit RPP1
MISFDFSRKLPFHLKLPTMGMAIERGIYFEISYGAAIRDLSSRRHLVSNAMALLRATKGRNIVLTSQAAKALDMRSPLDVCNLACLLGLDPPAAARALSANCRALLLHADTRRTVKATLQLLTPSTAASTQPNPIQKPQGKQQEKQQTKRKRQA